MLLAVSDAHEYLGRKIGVHRLRELMESGHIASFYEGTRLMTTKANLDKWIAQKLKKDGTEKSYNTKLVAN